MDLLDFCTNERQRAIIELYQQGLGYTKIAEKLGLKTRWAARDTIRHR